VGYYSIFNAIYEKKRIIYYRIIKVILRNCFTIQWLNMIPEYINAALEKAKYEIIKD